MTDARTTHRRPYALALLLACSVFSSCYTDATTEAPLTNARLVGVFDGADAELRADSTQATLEMQCIVVNTQSPIITDGHGNFTISATRRSSGGAPPIPGAGVTPVRLDGYVSAGDPRRVRLVLSVIPEEPGAPAPASENHNLIEGWPSPNFLACP